MKDFPLNLPVGIDEAGRGALAGPVVSAAVVFKEDFDIIGLDDSKKLTAKERAELALEIKEFAIGYGIGIAGQKLIDKENILQATLISMTRALQALTYRTKQVPTSLLIDGNQTIPIPYFHIFAKDIKNPPKQKAIVDGDALIPVISAASVLAKVFRDELMINFDKRYPQYKFAKHMGYGSKEHRDAIVEHGPSPIHRLSFKGVGKTQIQASLLDF